MPALSPDLLLYAYRQGLFPMADPDRGDRLLWFSPDPRAVIPLDGRFHVPKNLRKRLRQAPFRLATDTAFGAVIRACAAPGRDRESTWISGEIMAACEALHREGFAHSVECYDAEGRLVGGLYGVALGGAFFGESMFQRATDASKVALVHLVERLRAGGFTLLDTQFMTDHLARFGAYEIPRPAYERRLAGALRVRGDWHAIDARERRDSGAAGALGVVG